MKKYRGTKGYLLSKLYKKDLNKIAKKKGIVTNKRKDELIEILIKELKVDEIKKYYSKFSGIEHFSVLKHELVPKQKLLSEQEKIKLKEKFKISKLKQLPKIKLSDPSVLALGGRIGDVIEITRETPLTGSSKYYRIIVG